MLLVSHTKLRSTRPCSDSQTRSNPAELELGKLIRLGDQAESHRCRNALGVPTPTGGRLSVRRVLRPVGVGAESVPGV